MTALTGTFVVALIVAAYLLPTIVCYCRNRPNAAPVVIVNLFLGWTFFGWVVALAMAAHTPAVVEAPRTRVIGGVERKVRYTKPTRRLPR